MSDIQPPQFSNYPRATYMGTPYGRPPGVYIDAISDAWSLVKADLGSWIGASLLLGFVYVPMVLASSYVQNGGTLLPKPGRIPSPADWILSIVVSFAEGVIVQVLVGGMMRMAVKQVYGEQISPLDVFAGFKVFGSMLGAGALALAATYASLLACIVPGFFVSGALAFVPLIVLEQGVGPVEALKRSFNTLKPHAWIMFGLLFVAGLVANLGICLCGVGVLVTFPIYTAVIGLHYTYFFPRNPQPAAVQMYPVDPLAEDR